MQQALPLVFCSYVRFCAASLTSLFLIVCPNILQCRVILAQELCAHFAATNQAPEHVQTNPDALALWVQELMCRAYALQVVARWEWSMLLADTGEFTLPSKKAALQAGLMVYCMFEKPELKFEADK